MANLPIFQDPNRNFMMHQNQWKANLQPVITNPLIQGLIISDISLTANVPLAINTMLSRMQVGWILIDNTANATVYRTQPLNSSTLTLESSANTTISLWVF